MQSSHPYLGQIRTNPNVETSSHKRFCGKYKSGHKQREIYPYGAVRINVILFMIVDFFFKKYNMWKKSGQDVVIIVYSVKSMPLV